MSSLVKWLFPKKSKEAGTKTKSQDEEASSNIERYGIPERKYSVPEKTNECGTSYVGTRAGDSQLTTSPIQHDKTTNSKEDGGYLKNETPGNSFGVPSLEQKETTSNPLRQRTRSNDKEYFGSLNLQTLENSYGVMSANQRETRTPLRQRAKQNSDTVVGVNESDVFERLNEKQTKTTNGKEYVGDLNKKYPGDSQSMPSTNKRETTSTSTSLRHTANTNRGASVDMNVSDLEEMSSEKLRQGKQLEQFETFFPQTDTKIVHSSAFNGEVITSDTFHSVLVTTKPVVESGKTEENFTMNTLASLNAPSPQLHKTIIQGASDTDLREYSRKVSKNYDLNINLKEHTNTSQNYCDFSKRDNDQKDEMMHGNLQTSSSVQQMHHDEPSAIQVLQQIDKNQQSGDESTQRQNKPLAVGDNVSERMNDTLIQSTKDVEKRSSQINSSESNDSYESCPLHSTENRTTKVRNTESCAKQYLEQMYDDLQNICGDKSDNSETECKVLTGKINMDKDSFKISTDFSSCRELIQKVENKVAKEWQFRKELYEDTYRKALEEVNKVEGKTETGSNLLDENPAGCEPILFNKNEEILYPTIFCVVQDEEQLLTPKGHKETYELTKCGNKNDFYVLESSVNSNDTVKGSPEGCIIGSKNVNNNSNSQKVTDSDISKLAVKSKISISDYQSDDVTIYITESKSDASHLSFASANSNLNSDLNTEYRRLTVEINEAENQSSASWIEKRANKTAESVSVNNDGAADEIPSTVKPIIVDTDRIVCDNPSEVKLEHKLSMKKTDCQPKLENNHSTKQTIGDDVLVKSDSLSSLSKTNDSPVTQKLVLKIYERAKITNFEHYIQQRIGNQIKFKIEKVEVLPTRVDVVAEFPCESTSRKAAHILHVNNKKHKSKIWCSTYREKKMNENQERAKHESERDSALTRGVCKGNEQYRKQISQSNDICKQPEDVTLLRQALETELIDSVSLADANNVLQKSEHFNLTVDNVKIVRNETEVNPKRNEKEVKQSRDKPEVNPRRDETEVKPKVKPRRNETEVKPNKDETEVKPRKNETKVKPRKNDTEVKARKYKTEVKPRRNETEVKPRKNETEVNLRKNEKEVKPGREEKEVKPRKDETEVNPRKNKPEVKPRKDETEVKPRRNETEVKARKNEKEVKSSRDEREVKLRRDEKEVKLKRHEKEVKVMRHEVDVKPGRNEAEVKPRKYDTEVEPRRGETKDKPRRKEKEVKANRNEIEVKPRRNETSMSESQENKDEISKIDIKLDKDEKRNDSKRKSVSQESILQTKLAETIDLCLLPNEISSIKPVSSKTTETEDKFEILLSDQAQISEQKQIAEKSNDRNGIMDDSAKAEIPRLEDLAFRAALRSRVIKSPRKGGSGSDKFIAKEGKLKQTIVQKDDLNDHSFANEKEIINNENEELIPDDMLGQVQSNVIPEQLESDNKHCLSEDDDIAEKSDSKINVKTMRNSNTQGEHGEIDKKANTSGKPQIMEIEIVNLERKESNIERFLQQRISKPLKFAISEITIIDGVRFLSIEFSSTKTAKQARQLLHKSNSRSKTKVWCSFNNERRQKLKDQSLSKFVSELADVASDLIFSHNHNIKEISTCLDVFTSKKAKFQAVAQYQRERKEKEALASKMTELEKQKAEYRSFLSSLYSNLETLKQSEFDERDLTQLETAFKIECDRFSNRLPIYARRTDIVKLIDENQASVILGETGSGKSTQIVQYLYQTGRFAHGTIVCTQPRKVAAISLATHVAKEMASNVGHLVGYQVGLHTKKSKETKILYMTDHMLLNECLKDRLLTSFSCVVIDEAHERSIFTDLLLGMIKQCLPSRPNLHVVITSATIEPHVFVKFFGNNCPVLAVSGRTFPVDIEWSEEDFDDNYERRTLIKTLQVHQTEAAGDILAFLTSPSEVENCCKKFKERLCARNDFVCLPLHGKLQANEQQQVFTPPPRGKRKVVFATNSAETSITIPGIKFVIDSGRIKEMMFDPKKNISSLVVTMVTKSSADQRSGRAGRVAPGKCFRLYSQQDYIDMNACSTPEILRINLGQALLKLIELSVDPMSFDFVESPPKVQMEQAMDMLESIGAVSDGVITELGKWIAKLPFHPIYGVFVYDALKYNTGLEALVLTACCGSGGSLFYRSGSQEEKNNADKTKIRFSHQGGDIMTMLNAYREWHKQPERDKGKWCVQNYVNGKNIKAVRETVTEVLSILKKELQVKLEFKFNEPKDVDVLLQKMLFKTFKHNICYFLGHERAGYHVIHKDHNVCLFPSSALPSLGLQPEWIVIEQVLNITRDYGVNATPVPAEWIDEGIKEGWLKEFQIEKAEQQKVNLVHQVGLGDRCFRDFVGQRHSRVKELEFTLKNAYGQNIIIVDTDSKLGKIFIYAQSGMQLILKFEIDDKIVPIQERYKAERSEQYLCSTKQGTRVIMSAGCDIADILMPDEYKAVLIVSDPSNTASLTVEDVRSEFQTYGEIENIEMFHYTKNKRHWGKVTYKTTEQAEFAVEQSEQEDISARPTGNLRNQNEHRFRAKLEWCRRPSKGSGFVQFSDDRIADNILQSCESMVIGGEIAYLSLARNNNDQIFVRKLNKFVNEEVLKNSFLDKFKLGDRHIVRASIVREKVDTSRQEFESIRHRIDTQLKNCVKDGKFSLYLKPPKPQDFSFLGFASFSKIEEGQESCEKLVQNFRWHGEIITSSVTLQASHLVIRTVYEMCSDKIKQKITKLNEQDGTDIRFRLLKNGNCSIDINCDHIETLHRCRSKLEKITQGLKMTKAEFPNIHELFTRSGRYELKNTASQTKALIIDDYRILEIAIFGDRDQQQLALTTLQKYLHNLTLGITKTLTLKGPDKPYGVIKQMFMQFGIDLGKLKRNIKGLHCLQVDLRSHSLSMNGSSVAVDEAIIEVNKVLDHLRQNQNCKTIENEEDQCPICFMEIEDGEMYRLESCGHAFCNTCIVPQLESAVGNSDFPITCCKEGCDELWSWQDLLNLSLKSGMSINSLVNRATNSYVAKHDKEYKYCISPDCPSIYRVTSVSDVFCCCECEARICTACHIQYHDGMTCSMVKELKKDSSGIQIWLRKDPHKRKLCPNCGLPIEKTGGCNNMLCTKCKRNICWVCLEHFKDDRDCYKHLREVHGGFGGGY